MRRCCKGGALPVVGAVPAAAESTAGVEPAGGAEKASAATPEALELGAYGEAGSRRERPPGPQGKARNGVETPPREGTGALDEPERKRPSEGHPRAGGLQREGLVRTQKKATALTLYLAARNICHSSCIINEKAITHLSPHLRCPNPSPKLRTVFILGHVKRVPFLQRALCCTARGCESCDLRTVRGCNPISGSRCCAHSSSLL
jgi:hypothetical protein